MTAPAPRRESALTPAQGSGVRAEDADAILAEFAQQCEARGRAALALARHLAQLAPHQRTCEAGPYRIFESEASRQLVVLRAVDQLDGARCVHETGTLAAALEWMNARFAEWGVSAEA